MSEQEVLKSLGTRIKKIRQEKNMSQQDLAMACDFEIASMSRIESGKANPTINTLNKISIALNVHISLLLID